MHDIRRLLSRSGGLLRLDEGGATLGTFNQDVSPALSVILRVCAFYSLAFTKTLGSCPFHGKDHRIHHPTGSSMRQQRKINVKPGYISRKEQYVRPSCYSSPPSRPAVWQVSASTSCDKVDCLAYHRKCIPQTHLVT